MHIPHKTHKKAYFKKHAYSMPLTAICFSYLSKNKTTVQTARRQKLMGNFFQLIFIKMCSASHQALGARQC